MNEMKAEKHLADVIDGGAGDRLNEIFENYAWIVAVVMMAIAESGRVQLRDLKLAKEMVQTLTAISNLIEKERKRTGDRQADFAGRSWR